MTRTGNTTTLLISTICLALWTTVTVYYASWDTKETNWDLLSVRIYTFSFLLFSLQAPSITTSALQSPVKSSPTHYPVLSSLSLQLLPLPPFLFLTGYSGPVPTPSPTTPTRRSTSGKRVRGGGLRCGLRWRWRS